LQQGESEQLPPALQDRWRVLVKEEARYRSAAAPQSSGNLAAAS